MIAVFNGNVAMTQLLLESGASVDAADIHGRTALFLACDEGNISQVYTVW